MIIMVTLPLAVFSQSAQATFSNPLPVPYMMQGQTYWCWANSLAMVMQYYGKSVHSWDLARVAVAGHDEGANILDVVQDVRIASYIEGLGLSIDTWQILTSTILGESWNTIKSDIDSGKPIVFCGVALVIAWPPYAGHCIVINGYEDDASGKFLYVHDPSGYFVSTLWQLGVAAPYMFVKVPWEKFLLGFGTWWLSVTCVVLSGTPQSPSGVMYLTDRSIEGSSSSGNTGYLYLNDQFGWTKGTSPMTGNGEEILPHETLYVEPIVVNHNSVSKYYTMLLKLTASGSSSTSYSNSVTMLVDSFSVQTFYMSIRPHTFEQLKPGLYNLQISLWGQNPNYAVDEAYDTIGNIAITIASVGTARTVDIFSQANTAPAGGGIRGVMWNVDIKANINAYIHVTSGGWFWSLYADAYMIEGNDEYNDTGLTPLEFEVNAYSPSGQRLLGGSWISTDMDGDGVYGDYSNLGGATPSFQSPVYPLANMPAYIRLTMKWRIYDEFWWPIPNVWIETSEIEIAQLSCPRSGGPDNFGYTYLDSNSLIGPAYDWIEISATGTETLPSSDDSWVGNINLQFFFNYYGTDYSQLAIGNNGLLFSGTGTSQYVNQPITQTPSIHGLIASFWDDIVTWGSAGAIYYETQGTSPNRKFVVEWYDNQHYYSSTSGITFEAILYEGTNNILFQYKDVDFGSVYGSTGSDLPPYNNGGSATVGIEDPIGNIGLQYSFNQQVINPGLAILFKFPAFAGTNMYLSMNAPVSMDHGSTMTYTLYYNDFGDVAAQNVVLQTTLSSSVGFVSASDGGTYDLATRRVTWNIGAVPAFPSGRGTRTVTVTIPASVSVGTAIQTTASVSTTTLETRIDDNSASATTTVTGSNLPPNVSVGPTLGNSAGTPSVYWGTPITFTYYDSTATGVDIRIHLDDGGADITRSMTGGPPTWTYIVTFYPRHGHATVTYTIANAPPDGLHLPGSTGLIGLEQHLYNSYPGDGYVPPSGSFPATGLVGVPAGYTTYTLDNGYAGLGAFAPHPSDLSEKYYINMRWPDGVDWSPTQNHQPPVVTDSATYAHYAHKKVLITAPSTGKALIASIEEAGPALWTGKDAGAPPEVFVALGLYPRGDTQNDASTYTLNFEWADQDAPLGPCVPGVTFNLYVDPAGYVYNVNTLERLLGASVWLQRSDGQGGWENVPTGQTPAIMQPDVNPQITGADGQYQWDVLEGSYRVHVEAPGYYPADSIVVIVPPPVTDLHVGLTPLPPPPDPVPPTTTLATGDPKYTDPSGNVFVTSSTSFTLTAEDNLDGSGVATTGYRIRGESYNSGWTSSAPPIEFYLTALVDGSYFIDYNSTDNAGNIETMQTVSVTLDNSGPLIIVENPPAGCALQNGVTFIASASDSSGTHGLNFSIREANGDQGIPVGFEDIPATYNATTGRWNWTFNTLQLPDGFYIVLVNAKDNLGHIASIVVPYSIRNWAVLELLPATPNNKAGRTMPVKFALRVAASVDPNQPFVYNEELTIKIYATDKPVNILQTSTLGETARDYRINTLNELYITNFQTLKTPKTYMVEIWRKDMLIGTFQFSTVK